MTNLEKIAEIKEEIARLQKRVDDLEKSEKKTGRWKPQYGEVYFYITSAGNISYKSWYNEDVDINRYAIGNCFPTEEAAEFEREHLKVIAEMQEFAFEPDWNNRTQSKYELFYDHTDADIHTTSYTYVNDSSICFKTEAQAQACINSVGEERIKKYYFRIKETEK